MKKTNKIRRSFVLPQELRYVFRAVVLRRRPHGSISSVLPFISALSGCALLLFAAFSLLSPPPPHLSGHLHLHLLRSSPLREGANDAKSALESISAFVIPVNGGGDDRDLWRTQASNLFCGCSNASRKFIAADTKTQPNRFLLIATSGGLNQQRTGIVDAVVAAYILNATLVIPKLDQKSFWKDPSNFGEIFNGDWFISFLSRDVRIIKHLPQEEGKVLTPHNMRVPRKCTPHCYESRVIPVLKKKSAVQLTKFDYRLSNRLNTDLQRLRCRVNYHALNFTDSINEMGRTLVERMRMKSQHFIALHLRFEPDMLAFSGCYYGGGDKERSELGAIRKRWKTLHVSNPDKVRRHGRCPLTPEEVGLMLRALGYGSDVHIYVASGEVYGGEVTLAPLKALFPNFHSKETIASQEELAPFTSFSSRMAALDFIVCDESDVFVTNNNGNMAKILAGRRRYFGHKPTIRPNAKKLYKLFINRENTTWEEFASRVRTSQIGFMGVPNEIKPGRGEFHENPSSCICESSETNSNRIRSRVTDSDGINKIEDGNRTSSNGSSDLDYEQITDADHDWPELDYRENVNPLQGKTPNELESDLRLQNKFNQVELDEVFSD